MSGLLSSGPSGGARLTDRFAAGEMVLAPGCYDALSARLVEEAGFAAAHMTGFGTSAGRLGRPDVGLLTLTEMVDNARRLVQAVDIPVVADADTGYGNPLNVIPHGSRVHGGRGGRHRRPGRPRPAHHRPHRCPASPIFSTSSASPRSAS
jgi:isocitrate lyase